jgi:hypothetical protein
MERKIMQKEQDDWFFADVERAMKDADMEEVNRLWFERVMGGDEHFDDVLLQHILRTIQSDEFLRLDSAGTPLTICVHFFDWLSAEQREVLFGVVATLPYERADKTVGWVLLDLIGKHYDSTRVLRVFRSMAGSYHPDARVFVPYAIECHLRRRGAPVNNEPFVQLLRQLAADPDASVRSEADESLQRVAGSV